MTAQIKSMISYGVWRDPATNLMNSYGFCHDAAERMNAYSFGYNSTTNLIRMVAGTPAQITMYTRMASDPAVRKQVRICTVYGMTMRTTKLMNS